MPGGGPDVGPSGPSAAAEIVHGQKPVAVPVERREELVGRFGEFPRCDLAVAVQIVEGRLHRLAHLRAGALPHALGQPLTLGRIFGGEVVGDHRPFGGLQKIILVLVKHPEDVRAFLARLLGCHPAIAVAIPLLDEIGPRNRLLRDRSAGPDDHRHQHRKYPRHGTLLSPDPRVHARRKPTSVVPLTGWPSLRVRPSRRAPRPRTSASGRRPSGSPWRARRQALRASRRPSSTPPHGS